MEQFDIYTLGAGYYLEKIFNALVMILNGNFISVMKVASIGAVAVLAVRAGVNNDFKAAVKWFLGVTVLVSLFLTTKATVHIHDKLPDSYGRMSAPRTVTNVPWGLALMGSLTSQVGNSIAEKFDMALAGVFNNQVYQETGILFGSKIVEDISKLRIMDSRVKQFMLQFYKKCIVPDLNMGLSRNNGYTVKDLVSSDNILEFLSEHSSKARLINMPANMERATEKEKNSGANSAYGEKTINSYISCNDGAKYLNKAINFEADRRIPILANSFLAYFFPDNHAGNNDEMFKSVLAGSYGIFIKRASQDAKNILLQNMAINAIGDTIDGKVYGKVATESMTKSAYYSVAQMAQKFVPILRAVLECLFYGVFPLVLILMVTPIGLEVLKNYAFGFVYLQLWQPMYAILFCIASSWGKLYAGDIDGITFSSHAQIARINEEISSVAGYMLTLVPVLSLFITKGMVASMGNLASSIAYIPQSTAVQNAESMIKGNYQLGTTSVNTHSSNMSSGNKHDDNHSWMSGMKSFGMPSGSQEKMFSDGSATVDASGAVSNLAGLAKVDIHKAIGSRYDKSINDNMSSAQRHASNMIESTSSGYSKMLGFDQSFSKGSNAYESWSNSLTSDQRASLDEARSFVNKIAQEHGISQQDAMRVVVAASAKIGGGVIPASLSISAEGSTSALETDAYNKVLQASKDERFAESLSKIESFANSNSYQENSSINNNMIESSKGDFNRAKSANMEISKSMDKVHNLQEAKANFETNSNNISQDLTNQFAQENINRFGVGGFEKILRTDPVRANQLLNEFIDHQIGGGSAAIDNQFNTETKDFDGNVNGIQDNYQQNTQTIEQVSKANKAQIEKNAPEDFRSNVESKLDTSSERKKLVSENLKQNTNKIEEKSSKLKDKETSLKTKVTNEAYKPASLALTSSWNPMKKNE